MKKIEMHVWNSKAGFIHAENILGTLIILI